MKRVMTVTTRRFDLADSALGRTWRQVIIRRLVPMRHADYGGGPGAGMLIRLWLWHRFGRILCGTLLRFETPVLRCYVGLARLRTRLKHKQD